MEIFPILKGLNGHIGPVLLRGIWSVDGVEVCFMSLVQFLNADRLARKNSNFWQRPSCERREGLAEGLAKDAPDTLPFPFEKPKAVFYQPQQELLLRHTMIPAARFGQKLGLI